jgi:predicted permease
MGSFWQDVRLGARRLWKSPGFTLAAVLTLALGIGANTTIFSMVKAVLLRPLPAVQNPDELLLLMGKMRGGMETSISYPDYRDVRERADSFASLTASAVWYFNMATDGPAERVWGEVVGGNFFQVLGVRATLGRMLEPADDAAPGRHPVVVVSHSLWQRRFGGQRGVIGQSLRLNGHPFTIVGVAQKDFFGSTPGIALDVFVPLMMQGQALPIGNLLNERDSQWLVVQGRLKPGVTRAQAQAQVSSIVAEIDRQVPERAGRQVLVLPRNQTPFGAQRDFGPIMAMLMGMTGLVLLIASANVANLLLVRAVARRKETAVRLALGATRGRLVRQLLTESLLLALLAGTVGLLVTLWTHDVYAAPPVPYELPIWLDTRPDGLVLGFSALVALATTLFFGLVPAWSAARWEVIPALKEEASGRPRARLRNALVVAQVSLSVVALAGAGLFQRSFQKSQHVDPGFRVDNMMLASVDLRTGRYDTPGGLEFYRQLLERVRALPGVEGATLAQFVPLRLAGTGSSRGVDVEGYTPRRDEDMTFSYNVVEPDYLPLMGTAIVRGRNFSARDSAQAPLVIVVNETFAQRFWPGQDPVGRRLHMEGRWRSVIGVARDAKYINVWEPRRPYLYLPLAQNYIPDVTLHVRTRGEPLTWREPVRAQLQALNADLVLHDVRTLGDHVAVALAGPGIAAGMLGASGVLALFLAALGLYAVVAFTVLQRRREFSIRMALGARPRDILALVLRRGMRLVAVGLVAGIAGAVALARALAGMLYGVTPTDPVTYFVVAIVLTAVSLLAAYIPARRAARLDPMATLRYE